MASGGGIQAMPTELTGAVFTAIMWQLIQDNIDNGIVTQLGARATNSGSISIVNTTWVTLNLDTTTTDTDAPSNPMHSTTTNTSRMTINWTGWYRVSANIDWATNATGVRQVRFMVNGATIIAQIVTVPTPGGGCTMTLATDWYFTAGDYVECQVNQNSGGSLSVVQDSNYSPVFSCVRV